MLGGNKRAARPAAAERFALPDFLRDDAFALRMSGEDKAIKKEDSALRFKADARKARVKCALIAVVVAVLALLSLGIGYDGAGTSKVRLYSPIDALSSLVMWAAYNLSGALALGWFDGQELIDVAPLYTQVVYRAGITLSTLVCGALLAVAGMLYQIVFRNPIASPSLLGVTNGVKVGLLVMFGAYGMSATLLIPERFIYGYAAGAITLCAVFLLSKLITRRKCSISVFDMLVIGTIASTLLSAVSKYIMNMLATVDMWSLFFEFQEGLDIYNDPITYAVLAAATIVSLVPVILMRFRLNLLSFSDGEARVLGTNPRLLRVLTIVSGSIMILTAQVFMGSASSFALVIPFMARGLFGSEFRRQLWGNVLLGMFALLICRDLCALIPFVGVGIPIGTVAGIVTLPIFIWATMFARKAW